MDDGIFVLSEKSGRFFAGPDAPEPWRNDSREAMRFSTASGAWRYAKELQKAHGEFLQGGPISLQLYDPVTRKVTRLTDTDVPYYVLRPLWRDVLKTPLPLDIPAPAQEPEEAHERLQSFLKDADWNAARARGDADFGFDPSFWIAADQVFQADPDAFRALWSSAAPANIDAPDLSSPSWRSALEPPQTAAEEDEVTPFVADMPIQDGADATLDSSPDSTRYVARHFVQSRGSFYYKQRPDVLAFSMRGQSFRAHDTSVMTATAIVEMAQGRGWTAIRVRGTKDFRRAVWAAAMERGLHVTGYAPTHGETAILAQSASPEGHPSRPVKGPQDSGAPHAPDPSLTGVIIDMGEAPYEQDTRNSKSFFVTLRDSAGNEHTHWGVGLQRAMERTGATIGQRVRLERFGTVPVEVDRPVLDEKGDISYRETEVKQRRLWEVHLLDRTQEITQRPRDTDIQAPLSRDPQLAKALELIEQRLPQLPPEQREEFRRHFDTAYARVNRAPALSKSARGR